MTLFLSLFFSLTLFQTGTDSIPEPVQHAFAEQHPDVKSYDLTWGQEGEAYVASFSDERNRLRKVFFSAEGDWLQTQARVYPSGLPRSVYQYFENNCMDKDVTFLAKVQLPDGGVEYRIEWETFEAVHIERISAAGEPLSLQRILFTEGLEVW